MKFFAPLVVGVIAFLSSQVDANGVCYDPNHGTGMDASSVQADMKTIASHGFDSVRTFISKFGNTEMGPIIAAAGLKAMLGVPYPQSDYQEQMAAAIKAAQAGGVYAIMVGNENLAGASSVPGDMISIIKQIKSQVPEGVLVGTVQRNTEVIEHDTLSGWWDLVNNCDLLGVNAHPFFTLGTTADTAIQVLNNQWQTMVGTFGSKLILTETGWPSAGTLMGNVGSVAGTETFYNAYQQWSSSMGEKFYFQFFDTPYRHEQYEQTFGLVSYDSQDKFGMSVQVSVSIGQQSNQQFNQQSNQEQQTPSTEAPTNQQQTTDAPMYQQQTPATEAPTQAPTEAPTQPPTEAPTQPPTEAPTQPQTEATPVPTETPTIYQNSGSADYNTTTSGSSEITSVSSSGDGADSSNSKAASESSDSEQHQQTGKTGVQQSEQTTQQTTQDATPTGTNSQPQSQDNVQQANTQSSDSTSTTPVILGIAGGACAALVAFGFIYQTRKRAAGLEVAEGKHDGFSVTPMQNHCAL
ncbi:Glycoside hydrolase superfamily [Phytophthora cactorum]|nr:Glycoside hydrolase superfamily [Phytophthora cactorum]